MGPGQLHEILQRKCGEIRMYLIRLGATAADAEDVVQETLYKALLYMEAIDENKFSAWMYKVAINRYFDLCRREKRYGYQAEIPDFQAPEKDWPEERLLRQEQQEEIARTLAELKPLHRQLILLKYEMELSYQEIADLLGMTQEAVKATLFRARQQFKNRYGGE
ncbi:RNA polymerase sigma factor [Paenibacillus macerans]|uniref:RNA polymerase sigma factor n=1 Tax=Paenibacillus macerans TaxID=44252 RepID=UPI00203E6A5A|nr:sigma-70 family RNA polymerase sigma factor [Paenibacillus macerans]MCM3699957.1 sigma-70 family RNA polymerase sigma factor [Paenibacillus macerans]